MLKKYRVFKRDSLGIMRETIEELDFPEDSQVGKQIKAATVSEFVVLNSKGKCIKLTKKEIAMLIDAANRMEADDIWDDYSQDDIDALESGADKLAMELYSDQGQGFGSQFASLELVAPTGWSFDCERKQN